MASLQQTTAGTSVTTLDRQSVFIKLHTKDAAGKPAAFRFQYNVMAPHIHASITTDHIVPFLVQLVAYLLRSVFLYVIILADPIYQYMSFNARGHAPSDLLSKAVRATRSYQYYIKHVQVQACEWDVYVWG
jgi:hypothetical protein